MDQSHRKILLGLLGEKIVAKLLRDQGHTVEESLNVFDSAKDLLVNGKHVEVKTQVPLLFKDAFTVGTNQLSKIRSSYVVYWVSVPPTKTRDDCAGYVYQLNPRANMQFSLWTNREGRESVIIPRKQAAMKVVHVIEDPTLLAHLKELSSSYL
jgi:hypothetical protein